jgi:hypothetical protein
LNSPNSHRRAWLYLVPMLVVLSFLVRYGIRLVAELRGTDEPSPFAQVFAGLMMAFAAIILYGYWREYRIDAVHDRAASPSRSRFGCLLILVIVGGFACGLLVLAWQLWHMNP